MYICIYVLVNATKLKMGKLKSMYVYVCLPMLCEYTKLKMGNLDGVCVFTNAVSRYKI